MVAGTVEATCTIVANWLRDLLSGPGPFGHVTRE